MGADVWKGGLLVVSGLVAIFAAVLDVRPAWRAWGGIALTIAILGLQHRSAEFEAAYWIVAALPVALALVMASLLARRHRPDSNAATMLGRASGSAFLAAGLGGALMLVEPGQWASANWRVLLIASVYAFVAVLAILGRGAGLGWWTGFAAAVATLVLASLVDFAKFIEIWAPPALLCVAAAEAVGVKPRGAPPEYSDTKPAESA